MPLLQSCVPQLLLAVAASLRLQPLTALCPSAQPVAARWQHLV